MTISTSLITSWRTIHARMEHMLIEHSWIIQNVAKRPPLKPFAISLAALFTPWEFNKKKKKMWKWIDIHILSSHRNVVNGAYVTVWNVGMCWILSTVMQRDSRATYWSVIKILLLKLKCRQKVICHLTTKNETVNVFPPFTSRMDGLNECIDKVGYGFTQFDFEFKLAT